MEFKELMSLSGSPDLQPVPRKARPARLRQWAFRLVLAAGMALSALTLAAWLADPARQPAWETPREAYDPAMGHLRSVAEVIAAARASAASPAPRDQVHALEQVVRYRFYHGYSRLGFHENWMAWAAARLVHPHLDALVDPQAILAHQAAGCSQQGIIVQAALRDMGLTYATVETPAHFLSAAWLDGEWLIVDPWGPVERDRSRLHSLESLMTEEGRRLFFLTEAERRKWQGLRFQPPRLVKVNSFAAPNALLFHRVTAWASHWLWLPMLALALLLKPGGWGLRRRVRARLPGLRPMPS